MRFHGVGDFNGDGGLDALVWSPDDRSRWIASSCDGEWTLEDAGLYLIYLNRDRAYDRVNPDTLVGDADFISLVD